MQVIVISFTHRYPTAAEGLDAEVVDVGSKTPVTVSADVCILCTAAVAAPRRVATDDIRSQIDADVMPIPMPVGKSWDF